MRVSASTAIKRQAAACAGGTLPYDASWAAHHSLRALQRKGREMLARMALEDLSPGRRDDVRSRDVR